MTASVEKPRPCRYDRAAKAHLLREHLPACTSVACKGCRPCTHDENGNPARHCRARLRCTSHLGWDEYACPTCLGKIRANLTATLDALVLMPGEAAERGINSEPANLAGPHADYVTSQWRLVNADRAGQVVEELDLTDPYTCLTMHERTIREELGHDETTLVSPGIGGSASYLAWVLTDLARREDLVDLLTALLGDVTRLRNHVESALRDGKSPERGVPCPECVAAAQERVMAGDEEGDDPERLVRHYAHWCADEDCEREHVADDSADVWRCPSDPRHEWSHEAYTKYVDTRGKRRQRLSA